MRGIIAAVSPEGVIGLHGRIPWHYPADLKRFKRLTLGTTVIMGRHTWESLGTKPLPQRRNVVVTGARIEGVDCFATLSAALESCTGDVWFIGGAGIYAAAMDHCDRIDLTYVPDSIVHDHAVYFPAIDPALWRAEPLEIDADDPRLTRRIFLRR